MKNGATSHTTDSIKSTDSDAGKFIYEEKPGDLFSCDPHASLAHCISADIAMGKGIAVLFKKKFGGVDELKRQGMLEMYRMGNSYNKLFKAWLKMVTLQHCLLQCL